MTILPSGQRLLFRADASTQIGCGHVMRCLALAQAWQDEGGNATFVMAAESPSLEARLRSEGFEVIPLAAKPGSAEDAAKTVDVARKGEASWVVLDGYHFGDDYQKCIKDAHLRLLVIDDNGHARHYSADILLNHNIHAHEEMYGHREPYSRLLLGTRYALLKREFLRWQGWQRKTPEVARKVLVTLGGSDPDNRTLKVINALGKVNVEGLEAIAVAGPCNPYVDALQQAVRNSGISLRLVSHAEDMPALMAWADMAVAAGGSTCLELAWFGLPMALIALAENQRPVTRGFAAAGAALNLGWHEDICPNEIARLLTKLATSVKQRSTMSRCGRELTDGKGAARVATCLEGYPLQLRLACEADCGILWQWANSPEVRAVSFSTEPIPCENHIQWFHDKILDPCCSLYLATINGGSPIGQIRFDIQANEAVVSVIVAPESRGNGYGHKIIRLASCELFETRPVSLIHAYIKPGNEASARAFEKAGFKNSSTIFIHNQSALDFVLRRNSQ